MGVCDPKGQHSSGTVVSSPARIALIGAGSIGRLLIDAASRLSPELRIVGALVRNPDRGTVAVPLFSDVRDLLEAEPDVVIECAGANALETYGPSVLRSGADLIACSAGIFANDAILDDFRTAARDGGSRLRLSSGAVAGVDGLLAAKMLGLDTVRYRFAMSPAAWDHDLEDAPRVVVYRGDARDAARRFPRHANVTATIALAGVGFDRTEVEIVVDRDRTSNLHEVEASGFFGQFSVKVAGLRIGSSTPSSRLVAGALLASATAGYAYTI